MTELSEYVYWLADEEQHAIELIKTHLPRADGQRCAQCDKRWPCQARRSGEQARALRLAAPSRDTMALTHLAAGAGQPDWIRGATATVWRAEAWLDNGTHSHAQWHGRADCSDADTARAWLAARLNLLRLDAHHDSGAAGLFWGEVTAGRYPGRAFTREGTAVPVGEWHRLEPKGATATGYLWTRYEPITWDEHLRYVLTPG
jgi:hypothetical protein